MLRLALYTLIIVIVGAVVFGTLILPRAVRDRARRLALQRRAARVALLCSLLLLPVVAARLLLQLNAMRFPGDPLFLSFRPLVTATTWGTAWILQLVAAATCAVSFRLAGSRRFPALAWLACSAAALALLLSLPLSGHAAGVSSLRAVAVVADAIHVAGAGGWLGSLGFVLFLVLRPTPAAASGAGASEKYDVVRAFSPVAMACVGVIAASGVVSTLFHVRSFTELVGGSYGRTLLVKLAFVAVAMLLGYVNWKRNTPRMTTDGGRSMTRGVWRELTAAVFVLVVTSVLVVTAPPMP
jgi:putative copper export protein